MKGCICLDIDGTITDNPVKVPKRVLQYFCKLYQEGWRFVFVTGRSYSFAWKVLHEVDFPFYLALQNGADILQMPEEKQIFKSYLSADFIAKLEDIYSGVEEDFIIYSGWQTGDFCYYRPHRFSQKILEHFQRIEQFSRQPWKKVDNYLFLQKQDFPLIKALGSQKGMHDLVQVLHKVSDVEATYIKDPVSQGVYNILITAKGVSKGGVIQKMRTFFAPDIPFIAAGDDFNDVPMFKEADVSIVMETAPPELFVWADVIAESATKMGIIAALEEVIQKRI